MYDASDLNFSVLLPICRLLRMATSTVPLSHVRTEDVVVIKRGGVADRVDHHRRYRNVARRSY